MDLKSFRNYISHCNTDIEDLVSSLSKDDRLLIKQIIETIGEEKYEEWFDENSAHIAEYVEASPSQRKRKKDWNSPLENRLLLTLAAIHYLQHAKNFLVVSEQLQFHYGDKSWRNTAKFAGAASLTIQKGGFQFWLF